MERNKLLLIIGLSVAGIGMIIGVVFFLRSRNQVSELPPLQTATSAIQPSTTAGAVRSSEKLTPQEQKERDMMTQLIKNAPGDVRDTWTPEYRAAMEATTK